MKLVIRILVLMHGFLTFSKGVNYENLDIYKVKFVDDVHIKRPQGHMEFEVDENQVNTDKLSDAVRMIMCKTAAEVVMKQNMSVTFVGDKPEKKKSYFLSTSGSYTVQFVDAFKCPSKPELYLQVIQNENDEETVNIILQSQNKNAAKSSAFEKIQYTLKIVTKMSRATEDEMKLYYDEEDAVDQNAFGEDGRFRMCRDAINRFSGEGIILRENDKVRIIKFYKLYSGKRERRTQFDFVQAFQCPSSPPTFISVPRESRNGFKAWLILEEEETSDKSASAKDSSDVLTPPSAKTIFYKYELKPAKVIIDVTIGSSAEANITSVIRSAVNLNRLDEKKRRKMCGKAVGKVENDYRFVRYFPEEATGPSECYAVHSDIGDKTVNIEIVEAFKCPTKPPILIHVNELKRDEGLVWVVIKDWKIDTTFEKAVFNVNPVKSIEKATTGDIVRKLTSSREQSSMDSDDLTPDERHDICHRAIKNISGKKVKYSDVPPGMSKLYIIRMKEAVNKKAEKKGSDSDSEGELLRAFECPTDPAIFLEVALDWELEKCFVHILIKENNLNAQCEDLCYQIKFVEKIVERSKFKGKILFDIPQTEVVDTDELDEVARMEMCEKAVDIDALRGKKFRFLPKTKTEPRKAYVLDLKGAGRRSTPELVDAFKCPVKPAVYLHMILTDDKKKIVYVIFNDSEEEEVKFLEDEVTERSVEICRRALGLTPVEDRPKGDGKHKYYLFSAELAGTGVEKVSGKDVLRRFICPTKPSLNLEIHRNDGGDDSDDDYTPIARPAWRSRGLSRSKVREVNYKKKYVDRIIEAPLQNKFRKKTDREEFHEVERYEMCKDASKRVFRPPIELMKNKRVGKTMTYELHYDETESIENAQAFHCPTIPPIFLEVLENEGEESNFVWVILEQDQDGEAERLELHDDMQYEVKYITEIKKATSREITNFEKRRRSPIVDAANYAEEDRYKMCKEAAKQVPGRRVKFMELLAGETRYYNIRREDYETHRESDIFEMVMAFECPTIPQMHLQLEDNGQTVSIIVKRVPPIRDGIRAYRLKVVKSIGDVDEKEKQAYEVMSLLSPDDLEYDDQMRRRMCVRGMKIIPNTDGFLTWLENEDPGEEQFYAVETRTDTSITRQVLSAFECPTDPPFYLETFIDRNFRRSIRVIIDEERFYFSLEYVE